MSASKVSLTFTFHRKGVQPPLFVAGSFSNPPWQPIEMDATVDQHGDFIFTKQVMVAENSMIQYKFRHASGDWWALDPDADTVTDDNGNLNSLLRSPAIFATQGTTPVLDIRDAQSQNTTASHVSKIPGAAERPVASAKRQIMDTDIVDIDSPRKLVEDNTSRHLPLTPIEEATNTISEAAGTAFQPYGNYLEIDEDGPPLMFSHECFAPPSDDLTLACQESDPPYGNFDSSSEPVDQLDTDYDNPQLEHFPSDHDSIIATMRRLSTTIEADPTVVDTFSLSPIMKAKSSTSSSPSRVLISGDSTNYDYLQTDNMSRQPSSIAASGHSLQSIIEGDEIPDGNWMRDGAEHSDTAGQHISPDRRRSLSSASLGSSNADEGISMNTKRSESINDSPRKKTTDDAKHLATLNGANRNSVRRPTEVDTGSRSFSSKDSEINNQASLQKPTNGKQPQSIREHQKGNWLGTFFHTVFVDWIGGLFGWLCGRSQNEV
ncbi:putative pt repeat family protein [Rosellinia necatrix]|uniref:Putative pt repeat family protein n=1 Tax=Rosellinia necatrix TaxID=77044 RepID=A0A1W2TJU8_ROSNE|nr:putative pt repeat family protein [Rosellinia necatrix]